ncbi:hypothetical protein ACQP3J_33560, partial [Escherichia coli]
KNTSACHLMAIKAHTVWILKADPAQIAPSLKVWFGFQISGGETAHQPHPTPSCFSLAHVLV